MKSPPTPNKISRTKSSGFFVAQVKMTPKNFQRMNRLTRSCWRSFAGTWTASRSTTSSWRTSFEDLEKVMATRFSITTLKTENTHPIIQLSCRLSSTVLLKNIPRLPIIAVLLWWSWAKLWVHWLWRLSSNETVLYSKHAKSIITKN